MRKTTTPKTDADEPQKKPRGGRRVGSKSARKLKGKPIPLDQPLGLETERFQRIQPIVAFRAAELRARGFVYREIPALLVEQFGIELPALTTVMGWLNRLDAAVTKDFQTLQERMRMDCFWQIEEVKGKWMHRAQGAMSVRTTELTDEGFREVIDDNAFNEQAKAAKVVLDCIKHQAALLKLNLADEDKKGGVSLLDLQLWIVDRANNINRPLGEMKTVEGQVVGGPKLEVASGVDLLGIGDL
jgi:hypothetical protein